MTIKFNYLLFKIGDLFVAGLIDGVNMTDDTVLLTSSNQAVGGTITFSKPVTFEENLSVDGNIDGVDISDLEAISVYKNATHFIEGKINVSNFEMFISAVSVVVEGSFYFRLSFLQENNCSLQQHLFIYEDNPSCFLICILLVSVRLMQCPRIKM